MQKLSAVNTHFMSRLKVAAFIAFSLGGAAWAQTYDQCIIALNPSASNAVSLNGSVNLSAPNCGVWVDSSSSTALRLTGTAHLAAKYVRLKGGSSVSGGASVTPAPQTNAGVLPDPLTFLIPPARPSQCDYRDFSVDGGSPTLNPGTYCNGISVKGTANVTLNPGLYILMGGGLKVSGSSTVDGAGVTFFLAQGLGFQYGPLSVSGSAALHLSAPTLGPYYGILFYQDPSITHDPATPQQPGSTILGSTTSRLEGVLYFPTTGLTWSGNASASPSNYLIVVADTLTLTGSVTFNTTFPSVHPPLLPPVKVSMTFGTSVLYGGQSQQFTAVVTNAANPALNWTLSPSGTGTLSASGLYTAPATITTQQSVTVTATSVEDPTKSATATITLMPPVAVSVAPGATTLYGGQAQQFSASVINTSNPGVVWSLNPAGTGSVSVAGLYTAPATINSQQTVLVTATSVVDPTKSATAVVTLMPPVAVSVSPPAVTLFSAQTKQFMATVINASNTAVTWSVVAPGTGTINANGLYTAPALIPSQQTVTVRATSQVDSSKSSTATITLAPVSVTVAPLSTTLSVGQSQQFTAAVSNSDNTAVTWSVIPAGAGTVSATGVYAAPGSITTQQTVTVQAASQADPTKFAAATVTLVPGVILSLTPQAVTLAASQTQQFTVTSQGGVTWSLSPAGVGTISASGFYTAPDCIPASQTVVVTATSVADPTNSISATVSLQNANGYGSQRAIIIDHTKVPNSDLANFPVLISGTYSYLANAANGGKVQSPNGYDIVFTSDAGGITKLDHQIESYDPLTGQFAAWVRIPLLSHTTDTVIYLAYGNSAVSVSQENRTGVWDSSFKGVYHLPNGTSLSVADSTANVNDGTINAAAAATGFIGGASQFDGSSSYIRLPQVPFAYTGATNNYSLSFSVWFKTSTSGVILGQTANVLPPNGPGGYVPALYVDATGKLRASFFWHGSTGQQIVAPTSYNDGNWHHVVDTYLSGLETLYVDGQPVGTQTAGENGYSSNYAYLLGAGYTGGWAASNNSWFYFNGLIDEVQVSSVARSKDWIRAEYNNQSSPTTFYTVGAENAASIIISPLSAGVYSTQTQQFTATLIGYCGAPAVWTLSPGGFGNIDSSGLYTAPASIAAQQYLTVTATIQAAGTPKSASAALILLPPASVTVTPTVLTLYSGQVQVFRASVANALNPAVTWSLNPGVGSVDANGVYTAPADVSAQQVVTITATSQADPTKSASSTIALTPGQGNPVTSGAFNYTLGLVAKALCRSPHVPCVVDAGPDQYVALSCPTGQPCSASATVKGAATNFTLLPGKTLTYAWSLNTGPAAVAFANPSGTSTQVTFSAAGSYTLQLSANDGVSTSIGLTHVIVNPAVTGSGSLYVTPTISGPNAVGTSITFQVKWVQFFFGFIFPCSNSVVHMHVTGVNPLNTDIVTDANGLTTFTYTGQNPGSDTVIGTSDACAFSSFNSNAVPVTWITTPPRLTSSSVTGRFFTADGSGEFNIPLSQPPVFTQAFSNIDFNPAAGTVPGNTTAVTELTRPFTDIATDAAGNFVGRIPAQGNNYQAGTGPLYNFSAVFIGSLTVPAAGQVTFTFTSDDAFIFGVGNAATRISGPQVNTPANTTFQSYAVMGGSNQRMAPAANVITVNFPAAGAYPYEVDYTKGGDSKMTLTMLANGARIPAAALLTLTPNTLPPTVAGGIQSLTLSVTDADGVALSNLPVTVNVSGVNEQARQLTTDGTGQVLFAYAGSPLLTGLDQIQAVAVVNNATVASNVVDLLWNDGINKAPEVSAGSPQTITLPANAVLNGSVSDDGLPSNTLAVTWSMVSGPAAVTFDNPNQAVTAVAFSTPGSYVLNLAASDGALSTNSTVAITVNASTSWSSGWIQSPLDGSTISAPTPVTLVSGITLTGGTLRIFPSWNQTAVTVLNPTTTGTGQIGTLDPSTLESGSYFIELHATNSVGVTQTNLVLVNLTGDYKPGRVTATITDLTVPAPGMPIQIQRTYDSLLRGTSGDFGFGWNLNISVQMTVSPTSDVTLTINGRRRTFYFTPPANPLFSYWYTPQYTGEPGLFGSLTTTGDNCNGLLQRNLRLWQCAISNAGQFYQASGYRYTDPYGRVYTMDANGAIQSMQDLSGNTLTISAGGISSSNGLSVPFVRDSSGRITKITDTQGHDYLYGYDASGNLASVTYPGIATPAQYGYDATHLLTSEIDNRGNPAGSTTYYPDGRLQSVTDAVGNVTQYAYDTATRTTTVTNPDLGTVVTVADAYGMPLTVTDPLGRTTTYTYDANHSPLTETNALNQTTTYTYNAQGFRTSLKDPLNNTWSAVFNVVGGPTSVTNPLNQVQSVSYDADFRISAITDNLGSVAQFTYSAAGLPLTLIDARSNTSSYTYDVAGNRTSYTDPLTRATTTVYDTLGNLTSQTDPRGKTTTYVYDAFSRRTSMTDANSKTTQYAYDGNGNKTSETDALNRVTQYEYDNDNRVKKITYADTTTREYTYDWRNNKLTEKDQLGRITQHVYDLAGQLTSTTVAFGTADAATTSYTYDLAGRKLTSTDPRSNTTTNTYDAAGRLIKVRDPIGNETQYGYDAKGQRTSMTDAKNRVTSYTYDARGRQLTTTTPDTKTVTKVYDGMGLATSVTDEENRTTGFEFDAASQLKAVIDALNQRTEYTYDGAGNKLTQKDANNHAITYAYDNVNRRTSRTLPLGQAESFTYDAVSNMATRVDFNGKTTSFAYDSLNRQLSRTPDASFSAAPITFTYTPTGQRASMTDPSGTTTYTYTNRDQVATKATPQGILTYTYDLSGNVTSVVSSNANGTNVSYAWDANNRLQTVTDNRTSGTTNYAFDATNQLQSFVYPNGITHAYTYDNRDRMTGLTAGNVTYTQAFSFSGRKQSVSESTGRNTGYSYDNIYRLLNENITGAPSNGSLNYTLDAVGNRLALTSTLAALQSQTATYDADDRISADTFDANGNTLTSGGVTYNYDFEDRMVSTSTAVQITYDGDGNRVSETAGGVTTKFLVDEHNPTGYAQVAEEIVSGAVTAQYTDGLMRISQRRSGTVSYYGYDGGASVRQLSDSAGTVTDTYAYDAFGNTVAQTGSTVNSFRYRGEQYDSTLGMYYLRARYYRPQVGKFLTGDSYQGDDANPPSIHRYNYTPSDPVNFLDPTGHANIVEVQTTEAEGCVTAGRTGRVFLRAAQKLGCYAVDLTLQTLESEVFNEIVSLGLNFTGTYFTNPHLMWNVGVAKIAKAEAIGSVAGETALLGTETRKVIAIYLSDELRNSPNAISALINNIQALEPEAEILFSESMHVEQTLIRAADRDFILSLGSRVNTCDRCFASLSSYYEQFGLTLCK